MVGCPGGSAGKASACNAGDLGSVLELGRSPEERKGYPTPVFRPGEFHGLYSPWGRKESDTTEQLSLHVIQEKVGNVSKAMEIQRKRKKAMIEIITQE